MLIHIKAHRPLRAHSRATAHDRAAEVATMQAPLTSLAKLLLAPALALGALALVFAWPLAAHEDEHEALEAALAHAHDPTDVWDIARGGQPLRQLDGGA
jgi:hypothetical protein